jgi:hypothetical protein
LKEGIKEELEVKRNKGWTERKVYGKKLKRKYERKVYERKTFFHVSCIK